MDLTAAYAELLKYGLLGVFCLLLIGALIWAVKEKGKAEDALADSQKERVTEAKEVGKLIAEISRVMATLAVAIEASNRTSTEGNLFRQSIAGAIESLEKAIENLEKASEVQARHASGEMVQLREATVRLHDDVRRALPRSGS